LVCSWVSINLQRIISSSNSITYSFTLKDPCRKVWSFIYNYCL
jgi:hypothetical protein